MSKDAPKYPDIPDPNKVLDTEARLNRNTQIGPDGYTQWLQMPDGRYVQMQGMSPTQQAMRNAQLSVLAQPMYEGDPVANMQIPMYSNPIAPEGASSTFLPLNELDAINKRLRYDTNATDQASQNQGSGGTDSSGGAVSLGSGPMALNPEYWSNLGGALSNIGTGMDKSKLAPNFDFTMPAMDFTMPDMNFSNPISIAMPDIKNSVPINITNPINMSSGIGGTSGGKVGGVSDVVGNIGKVVSPGGLGGIVSLPNVAPEISVGSSIPKLGGVVGGVAKLPSQLSGSAASGLIGIDPALPDLSKIKKWRPTF